MPQPAAAAAAAEFTLTCEQRDFVEWRLGRTHYAVWAIDVDTPALRAATAAMRDHLEPCLLPGYHRQPHVTLWLCGFPSAVPRLGDDYPAAALHRQIAALQAAAPAPFALEVGRPDSFASAAYLSVNDCAGGIQAIRQALAATEGAGDAFPYTPHVTCGLYQGKYHLPTLIQRMAACRLDLPVRLQIDRLTLMAYEAAVIGGPLSSLCELDLTTRRARILDPQLMETLFGQQPIPEIPCPAADWGAVSAAD